MSRPLPPDASYDVLVVGSGPAGRTAALTAARHGARVALVERDREPGGAVTAGALPFRTLWHSACTLADGRRTGRRPAPEPADIPPLADLMWRADGVVQADRAAIRDRLRRERVALLGGQAVLSGPHHVEIRRGPTSSRVEARRVVLAVGAVPHVPSGIAPGPGIVTADDFTGIPALPDHLLVAGAGPRGLEVASVAAALGARVTLVDGRDATAPWLDREITAALRYHLAGIGVAIRSGVSLAAAAAGPHGVVAHLSDGTSVIAGLVVLATGRDGATAGLGLSAAGLRADARGRLQVDAEQRTRHPHVLAAGDVLGGPSGAAEAADQGRRAALAALGLPPPPGGPLPAGLSTIPEVACVGPTEQALAARGRAYVAGIARLGELTRGRMSGEAVGLLKLLADPGTGRVLAAHVLGPAAGDLVRTAEAVIAGGLALEDLVCAAAALDGRPDAFAAAAADAVGRRGSPPAQRPAHADHPLRICPA